jgi:hypothetical protein
MTATLFQDPLATDTAPAAKAPTTPVATIPAFMGPETVNPQVFPDLRRAQRDHAEAAKSALAAELAAALAGKKPLRTR